MYECHEVALSPYMQLISWF